eukprot:gene3653-2207_t
MKKYDKKCVTGFTNVKIDNEKSGEEGLDPQLASIRETMAGVIPQAEVIPLAAKDGKVPDHLSKSNLGFPDYSVKAQGIVGKKAGAVFSFENVVELCGQISKKVQTYNYSVEKMTLQVCLRSQYPPL